MYMYVYAVNCLDLVTKALNSCIPMCYVRSIVDDLFKLGSVTMTVPKAELHVHVRKSVQ